MGNSTYQCNVAKAYTFDYTEFADRSGDGTISNPKGSMFCVWSDYPGYYGNNTETTVYNTTSPVLKAFGGTLPAVTAPNEVERVVITSDHDGALKRGSSMTLTATATAEWSVDDEDVVTLSDATQGEVAATSSAIESTAVTVTAVGEGKATITAKASDGTQADYAVQVVAENITGTKTITLAVGESTTISAEEGTIATGNSNPSVADITSGNIDRVEPVTTLTSGESYLIGHVTKAKVLTTNTTTVTSNRNTYNVLQQYGEINANATPLWKYTGSNGTNVSGTLSVNGQYLTIGNSTASMATNSSTLQLAYSDDNDLKAGHWTIAQNVTSGWSSTTYYLSALQNLEVAGGWGGGDWCRTDSGSQWDFYKVTKGYGYTITGKMVGETNVTIGDTLYTINVVEESGLSSKTKTVEYWITNNAVQADGATSKSITADTVTETGRVYSEAGVKLSELVPETGKRGTTDQVVKFLKGTRLTSDMKQKDGDADRTRSGKDFTYIRYWNKTWSFSQDGTNWFPFNDSDQIVAYYMQKTDVTTEVTTYSVDWSQDKTYSGSNWVLLDFAVDYGEGTVKPNSFRTDNTLIFHCNYTAAKDKEITVFRDSTNNADYRRLGSIYAEPTANYEVYMITLTPTSDDPQTTLGTNSSIKSYNYKNGTEKVVWIDNEKNLPLDKTKDENMVVGGEPIVESVDIYNNHGMLVTYYVRQITDTKLTVNYLEEGTETPFYTSDIAVKSGTKFADNIGKNEENPNGDLVNATVTNTIGQPQTVTADLTKMSGVPATYRFSKFTCTRVVREADDVVNIYYTFDNTRSFVVDFGTPLQIKLSDLSTSLADKKASIQDYEIKSVTNGTAVYDKESGVITYTPDEKFTASESGEKFAVFFGGRRNDGTYNGITYSIHIYPASNVLYEEGFLTEATGWTHDSEAKSKPQSVQKAKAIGVLGYDDSYQTMTGANGVWKADGLGSGRKITAPLTTEFYGNTFDLIGNCNSTTGRVILEITEKDKPKYGKIVDVDTRYTGDIKQVPLAHVGTWAKLTRTTM